MRNLNPDRFGRQITFFPSLTKPHKYFYYPQCSETTAGAIINRHSPKITREYDSTGISKLYKHIRKFVCHPRPMEYEEYCRSMTPTSKVNMYLRELEHLETRGHKAVVCPFTKIEKMTTEKYKPPRLIQARHPSFNIMYGRYIKPLENYVTKSGPFHYNFGKGNYDQIALKIQKLKRKYKFFTELDHDSFDSRVTQQMLTLTHKFYQACYFHSKELRNLSKQTLVNRCIDRHGQKYVVHGTRMSGDVDTSFGNCLINYAILKQVLKEMSIDGDIIVNGDDSIIFTNQALDIELTQKILLKYNMESKMQPSHQNIHRVDFCRTRFVYRSSGTPTMMFDQSRLYKTFGMTFRLLSNYRQYIKELTFCHMCINQNVPTWFAWARCFDISGVTEKNIRHVDQNIIRLMERQSTTEVSSSEYTMSMFEAYPDILYWHHKIINLQKNIKKIYTMIVINHEAKKLAISY